MPERSRVKPLGAQKQALGWGWGNPVSVQAVPRMPTLYRKLRRQLSPSGYPFLFASRLTSHEIKF